MTNSTPTLPIGTRTKIVLRALVASARERRTKRALFFSATGLPIGATLAGWWGVLICGGFGFSLYFVVLVMRMQRHLQTGYAQHGGSADTIESEDPLDADPSSREDR